MNATVPLEEALPCSPAVARKILITDSVETDGRFLCYTFARQALATSCNVLWLVGTPVTDRQVATGLKKMGCDAAAMYLRNPEDSKNLRIRCLADEIATRSLEDKQGWNEEGFLKEVFVQIKTWLQICDSSSTNGPAWILLDDVSTLATILGEKLIYQFVDSICALCTRINNDEIGILIRCSHELDQALLNQTDEDFEKDQSGWLGAGGLAHRTAVRDTQLHSIPWERSIEAVDGIVDVVPLTSGYSREAHGRLVFSEVAGGRGWGERTTSQQVQTGANAWNKLLFNYCIHDNGVRAIRLRV
eukprot:scaffold1965_cov110-Cylindrotheca_fusiformis.AAC.6